MIETLKNSGLFQFGKVIPGLTIHGEPAPYPVLNERAVRAGAGIMLVLAAIGFSFDFFLGNYEPLKLVVALFFFDFLMKVIIGTRFSPISQLGELIVTRQQPEYVGAIQKRFAWSIGLVMSFIMILVLYVFELQGPISLTICTICLTFMWLESAAGICVGCAIYYGLIDAKLIKAPEYRPACPGGVCSIQKRPL